MRFRKADKYNSGYYARWKTGLLGCVIVIACSASVSAQDNDSLVFPEGYYEWSKPRYALRIGAGNHFYAFGELGVARHKFIYSERMFASIAHYASFSYTPAQRIPGVHVGTEFNIAALALGLELGYLNDHDSHMRFTPKVGIGRLGIVNVFYGYHIFISDEPYPGIGRNQFSVVVNLSRRENGQ
ncbi:MAG: hypothetical protein KDD36_11710 [Flavobacteriales bacterium]|nr:hypothetical protein [Flavobacteriales bacterium]